MSFEPHAEVILLDSSIVNLLCNNRYAGKHSETVQELIQSISGQVIRTDSTHISGLVLFELLGLNVKALLKSRPELFGPVEKSDIQVAQVFKNELERTLQVLEEIPELTIQGIRHRYQEHLRHQSRIGREWLEGYLGHHINEFSESHRKDLIRRIAIEIVVGREFLGFEPKHLGLQFAVMYLTGLSSGDSALASARAIDKIIAPIHPATIITQTNTAMGDFRNSQKYRNREELLDVEMMHLLMFGHSSESQGTRPVVAFTCESADAIEARINAISGFLVTYKEVHGKSLCSGRVVCVSLDGKKVLHQFRIENYVLGHLKSLVEPT